MTLKLSERNPTIALLGLSASGKTTLMWSFLRKVQFINNTLQRRDPFGYRVSFSIGRASHDKYLPVDVPLSFPEATASFEDSTYRFERRFITTARGRSVNSFVESVNSHIHNIVISDNPGERFVSALENSDYEETAMLRIAYSDFVILTIDASSGDDSRLFPTLRGFVQALRSASGRPRYIAICFTKIDKLRLMPSFDERGMIARIFRRNSRDEFESLIHELNKHSKVKLFFTSAVGYYRAEGKIISNVDNNRGQIKDYSKWEPFNVERPFFWLFEQIELSRLFKNEFTVPLFEKIFRFGERRLQSYISYDQLIGKFDDQLEIHSKKPLDVVEESRKPKIAIVRGIDYMRPSENLSEAALEITNTSQLPIIVDDIDLDLGKDLHPIKTDTSNRFIPPRGILLWRYLVEPESLNLNYRYEVKYHIENSMEKLSTKGYGTLSFESIKKGKSRTTANPYTLRALGENSPLFFGRKEIIDMLFSDIGSASQGNVVVLFGQRRTGKTSLLYALKSRATEDLVPILFDVEGRTTEADFYGGLAMRICDECNQAGLSLSMPKPEDFVSQAAYKFENIFLRSLQAALGHRHLLIMLDEFEYLQKAVDSGGLDKSIFPFLRNLIQHQRFISFLFCGTHLLNELSQQYWEPFFNNAINRRVTFLDKESIRQLIVEPTKDDLEYDILAIERIWSITSGHPFFTQLLCRYIVDQANHEKVGLITTQLVNAAVTKMLIVGNENLDALWSDATNLEKEIMRRLSQGFEEGKRFGIRESELYSYFERHYRKDDFEIAINRLQNKEISKLEDGYIDFMMELVPLWLNLRHPN